MDRPGPEQSSKAPGGTILLVSHSYPPRQASPSVRSKGLAKYLFRLGYRVIVLTSGAWGDGTGEGGGEEPHPDVVRTRDLFSSRLNWRRRNVAAYEGRAARNYSTDGSLVSRLVVPDLALITWLPFALPEAIRIARRERVDCVLTSSGPESVNLIGLALSRRGIPWVADLRDGWSFESDAHHRWRWRWLARLDARLESAALRRADRVVTVSRPISDDLGSRLGIAAATIPNGFDPEEAVPANGERNWRLDPERHSIVHTGLVAAAGRSTRPILAALRLIGERSPEQLRRLEVVFVGPTAEEEARMLADPRLAGSARSIGPVERPDALRLQRDADSLLVITSGARRGEVPGKLFEYLQAGRPVLVLGERTEAARIVGETSSGLAAPADDPEAIAAALLRASHGEIVGNGATRAAAAVAEYAHPRMAERMAAEIEAARGARVADERPVNR